jgi:hypothetical protein
MRFNSTPGLAPLSQPATGLGASARPPASELSSVLFHLLGEAVVDREGHGLGTIDDLLVDRTSGCIAYAVMVRSDLAGDDERQLVLPWSALHFDPEQRKYVLDTEERQLADAPCIDHDRWPAQRPAEWHLSVHRHYGAVPYWRR